MSRTNRKQASWQSWARTSVIVLLLSVVVRYGIARQVVQEHANIEDGFRLLSFRFDDVIRWEALSHGLTMLFGAALAFFAVGGMIAEAIADTDKPEDDPTE